MIAPASISNPGVDFILNAANWEKVLDALSFERKSCFDLQYYICAHN